MAILSNRRVGKKGALLKIFRKYNLFPIFLTYFLDNFGLAIIYPIFTPLFFQNEGLFFEASTTYLQKTILLGLLIGSFPLAQFFGAPLIGQFSDRVGRKKAFYITILGTAFGYTITAFSILENSLGLLFASRVLTGLCAGNLTICLAAIADQSVDQKTRTKNFGSIAAIGGVSFVLAILSGGILSDPKHHPLFDPSFPFWLTAALSYINFFIMLFLFEETHPKQPEGVLNAFQGVKLLFLAVRSSHVSALYFVNFLFMLSWVATMQFFPITMFKRFHLSVEKLTICLAGVGLIWSFANLLINRYLCKRYYPGKTLLICLSIQSVCLFALSLPLSSSVFLLLFYPAAFCAALNWTNAVATVSLKAPSDMQGSILGVNQSMTSVAAMLGPALGGIIVGWSEHWIFIMTGLFSLLAFVFLFINKLYRK